MRLWRQPYLRGEGNTPAQQVGSNNGLYTTMLTSLVQIELNFQIIPTVALNRTPVAVLALAVSLPPR